MYEVYSYFSSKLGVHYKIGISNICSIFNGKSLKKLNTWNSLKNQQNHHENANATGGTQSIFLSFFSITSAFLPLFVIKMAVSPNWQMILLQHLQHTQLQVLFFVRLSKDLRNGCAKWLSQFSISRGEWKSTSSSATIRQR